ncbi:MAG: hypothetical protein AB7O65_04235 [Candidatus Korobacteraceae bacterium]
MSTWRLGFPFDAARTAALIAISFVLPSAMAVAGEVHSEVAITRRDGSPARDASNVVVWLIPVGDQASTSAPAPGRFTLSQKNKQFSQHLLVVPVGSVVEFPNLDPFFHNVFSFFQGKRFDLGLYEAGRSRGVKFDRVGVSFIFCNIHPEMSAAILALPTKLYGVSSSKGELRIQDVPPGQYRMQVWHELASPQDLTALARTIRVENSSTDLGRIAIREVIEPNPPHKNKYGQDYEQHPRYDPGSR